MTPLRRWMGVVAACASAAVLAATGAGAATTASAGAATTASAAAGGTTAGSAASAAAAPHLDATAAALLDADTGQLLLDQGAERELPIASATKLMTALVTLEHARLGAVFTQPLYYPAPADSQIGLVPGERMTVRDLLLALLLPSADDAAEDLASGVGGGSVARFIALMNARARQLGLSHTHYSTPIGLDTPGNYSSAGDLVRLARYVRATQPFFREAVALPRAELRSGARRRVVVNRNDLIGAFSGMNGVKTGHTLQAGYVLIGSATRAGTTLISAVLGTPSLGARDAATVALLRYGFSAFRLLTPVRPGEVLARARVHGRPHAVAEAMAADGYTRVFGAGTVLSTRVALAAELTGPLARGARVGAVRVLANGAPVAVIPLVLAHAVPAPPPSGLLGPISLVIGLLLVLAAVLVTGFARRKTKGTAAEVRRRR